MVNLHSNDICTPQLQQVFLLEDDVGGGLILTANSMQRLPPWPEGVSELLESVCAVLHAFAALQAAELGTEARAFSDRVLAEVGRRLEGCTGRLDSGSRMIYLGKAGGFVCGPVPWTQPMPLSPSRLAPPSANACTPPVPRCPEPTDNDPWEQELGWERAR